MPNKTVSVKIDKEHKDGQDLSQRDLKIQSWKRLGMKFKKAGHLGGQSVGHPTLAQVMISQFVSSSPSLGSVPTARSLEPASDSVFHSPSASPPLVLCLSLSLKNK